MVGYGVDTVHTYLYISASYKCYIYIYINFLPHTASNCNRILTTILDWGACKAVSCLSEKDKEAAKQAVANVLLDGLNAFLDIIRAAVKCLPAGMKLLNKFKNKIIEVLKEKSQFAKPLVKAGVFGLGCKCVGKKLLSTSIKSAGKLVKVSSPLSLAADLAQTGLEVAGYNEAGQTVGMVGNIAGGALLGSIAGPPGAAVGALGGFVVWLLGEAAGRVVEEI